jgi:ABC-type uncharacterized transport system substrate-binding protein
MVIINKHSVFSLLPSIKRALLLLAFLLPEFIPSTCMATEVIVVADSRLRPVVNIISGIRKSCHSPIKLFSPAEVKGKLGRIAEKEEPRVVITLGREALAEALQLPSAIPVIYDLVVTPPPITRPNTTGFYMAIPARDYLNLIRDHLHSIKKVAVVGSRDQLNVLATDENPLMASYSVGNPFELVDKLGRIEAADAILLLPDSGLLSATAMEQAYLLSFRRGIPLLGISEKQVKDGALLALVVDTESVGRQIGEYAAKALRGINVGKLPPSPPKRFDIFLNADTARKMGIQIPAEMIRMAKKAYP